VTRPDPIGTLTCEGRDSGSSQPLTLGANDLKVSAAEPPAPEQQQVTVPEYRPLPRLDEVPELDKSAWELTWAHVDDVFVRPVVLNGGIAGWVSIIFLVDEGGSYFGPTSTPWLLPVRETEELARWQAQRVLTALLEAREEILTGVRKGIFPSPAMSRATADVLGRVQREWVERRNEWAARFLEIERGRRELSDTVPPEVVEWGALVRETRKRWGWTQRKLAEHVGIDTPRLSKIETGKLDPPRAMMLRLCSVLDLHPPANEDMTRPEWNQ